MKKTSHFFNFYGVFLQLTSEDLFSETVINLLVEDFYYFLVPAIAEGGPIHIVIDLQKPACFPFESSPLFHTRACSVSGWGERRVCVYSEDTHVANFNGKQKRLFVVSSSDLEQLYEIVTTIILSAAGEESDNAGLHRIHALGLNTTADAALVILPSGGGKSAIHSLLLKQTQFSFFSDESPLLRNGKIYSFPYRSAVRFKVAEALGLHIAGARVFRRKSFGEKLLFPIPQERVSEPAKLTCLLIGSQTASEPHVSRIGAFISFFSLLKPMVVGIGLTQMAEYMLRLNSLPKLATIGFSRLREAWKISRQAENFIFYYNKNAFENEAVLKAFFDKRKAEKNGPETNCKETNCKETNWEETSAQSKTAQLERTP